MKHHFEFLRYLREKGGPDIEDYYDLNAWIVEIYEQVQHGHIRQEVIHSLIDELGDAFSISTMQGLAFHKPHGYPGDYEIIYKIYKRHIASEPHLRKWDLFWHDHAAAEAVRNRSQYFCDQMAHMASMNRSEHPLEVLNLASGPGYDMVQFFDNYPMYRDRIVFDCVEQDINAINFASKLCEQYLEKITFLNKNALRFGTQKKYDVIWSAGLFDYFEDKVFVFLIKRFMMFLAQNGSIIIGNFSTINPSKPYMSLFRWHLYHRSPHALRTLAIASGIDKNKIEISKEPMGVNLFLQASIG